MGDFNFPSSYRRNKCENIVYSEILSIECQQCNEIRNLNDQILDLCYSSIDWKVSKTEVIINKSHYAELDGFFFRTNLKTSETGKYS